MRPSRRTEAFARSVALLCIDPWEETSSFRPFNYAVRRIQAALVAVGIEATLVESKSTEVDGFLDQLDALRPDVVGFSAYLWSFPTFVEIARRLKARRPEVVTVFGGPSARTAMFELEPFFAHRHAADAIVEGEGEEVITALLALPSLDPASLARLPGVAVPTRDGWQHGPPAASVENLDALPSPYALGLVPPGMTAHLETFRGCPLSCTFCQWGEGSSSRSFGVDAIADELTHVRRLGLDRAILIDAGLNLNSRAFRALAEAERRTRVLRDVALSFEVYPSYLNEEHLAFLSEIRTDSIGVGLQSYDQAVLKRVQRTFDPARFEQVVHRLAELDTNTTIEIILGLPGDHPASFTETLTRARALPANVRVYHCLVLPDALMTRAGDWATMRYDPWTLQMQSCAGWSERELLDMRATLSRSCSDSDGWDQGTFWYFPQEHRRGASGPNAKMDHAAAVASQPSDEDPALTGQAMALVAAATQGRWAAHLTTNVQPQRCSIHLSVDGVQLILDLETAGPGVPAFIVEGGVAISYRSPPVPLEPGVLVELRSVAGALAALFRARDTRARRALPLVPVGRG